ncbi:unnamed protein product, partial [Symbiodinium sp. CCMP2456]
VSGAVIPPPDYVCEDVAITAPLTPPPLPFQPGHPAYPPYPINYHSHASPSLTLPHLYPPATIPDNTVSVDHLLAVQLDIFAPEPLPP